MIFNLQFEVNIAKKLRETMGGKLFMESYVRFS